MESGQDMAETHEVYLSLGSNIKPEWHLREAVRHLRAYGQVDAVSNAWQTHSVGSSGPDYLNACVRFLTPLKARDLKAQVIRPVEAALGRIRGANKFAPRTIDIDIILFDDDPYGGEFWSNAFVVVPLAEIHPNFQHPLYYETLSRVSASLRQQTWIEARPEVLPHRAGR